MTWLTNLFAWICNLFSSRADKQEDLNSNIKVDNATPVPPAPQPVPGADTTVSKLRGGAF